MKLVLGTVASICYPASFTHYFQTAHGPTIRHLKKMHKRWWVATAGDYLLALGKDNILVKANAWLIPLDKCEANAAMRLCQNVMLRLPMTFILKSSLRSWSNVFRRVSTKETRWSLNCSPSLLCSMVICEKKKRFGENRPLWPFITSGHLTFDGSSEKLVPN